MSQHTEAEYRAQALKDWGSSQDVDVDIGAAVSLVGDGDGAWVAAWVWVPDEEVKP